MAGSPMRGAGASPTVLRADAIMAAARSATITTGAPVWPPGILGITDESTTRRPSTPCTLRLSGLTTPPCSTRQPCQRRSFARWHTQEELEADLCSVSHGAGTHQRVPGMHRVADVLVQVSV